jgi:hypothetical protein
MPKILKYARMPVDVEDALRRNVHDYGVAAVASWLETTPRSLLCAMAGVASRPTADFVQARWREKGPLVASPSRTTGGDERAHFRCEVP